MFRHSPIETELLRNPGYVGGIVGVAAHVEFHPFGHLRGRIPRRQVDTTGVRGKTDQRKLQFPVLRVAIDTESVAPECDAIRLAISNFHRTIGRLHRPKPIAQEALLDARCGVVDTGADRSPG